MTVNELIKKLEELAEKGYGETEITIIPYDDYPSGIYSVEEKTTINKEEGTKIKRVFIYQS